MMAKPMVQNLHIGVVAKGLRRKKQPHSSKEGPIIVHVISAQDGDIGLNKMFVLRKKIGIIF